MKRYMVEIDRGGQGQVANVLKASIIIAAADQDSAEEEAEAILRVLNCNGYVDAVYELA